MKQDKAILTESMLREAFGIYAENLLLEYPSPVELTESHAFSPAFEAEMEMLVNKQKKPWAVLFRTASRRIAMLIVSILLSLTVTVFGVEAIRKPFIEFVVQTFETFTDVLFPDNNSENSEPVRYITPTYITDGYVLDSLQQDDVGQNIVYFTEDGIDLVYQQWIMDSTTWMLDTEDATLEEIMVGEMPGLFFSNKGYNNLLFKDNTYSFYLSGVLSKEELLKIAKSIK